jgi:ribosomal protein L7Ae-like RNA K-turn-binding protein
MSKHLGLAFRAKKVSVGTENVVFKITSRQAKLVLLASDAAIHTTTKIKNKTNFYGIELNTSFDSVTLSKALGKNNIKVVSINDQGFAKLIQTEKGSDLYAETNETEKDLQPKSSTES